MHASLVTCNEISGSKKNLKIPIHVVWVLLKPTDQGGLIF